VSTHTLFTSAAAKRTNDGLSSGPARARNGVLSHQVNTCPVKTPSGEHRIDTTTPNAGRRTLKADLARKNGILTCRTAIARLKWVVTQILARPGYWSAKKLAAEYETSSKTIQRDLMLLRDMLGHELAFDPAHNGWSYLSEPKGVL
jgi:hypothetical protein